MIAHVCDQRAQAWWDIDKAFALAGPKQKSEAFNNSSWGREQGFVMCKGKWNLSRPHPQSCCALLQPVVPLRIGEITLSSSRLYPLDGESQASLFQSVAFDGERVPILFIPGVPGAMGTTEKGSVWGLRVWSGQHGKQGNGLSDLSQLSVTERLAV